MTSERPHNQDHLRQLADELADLDGGVGQPALPALPALVEQLAALPAATLPAAVRERVWAAVNARLIARRELAHELAAEINDSSAAAWLERLLAAMPEHELPADLREQVWAGLQAGLAERQQRAAALATELCDDPATEVAGEEAPGKSAASVASHDQWQALVGRVLNVGPAPLPAGLQDRVAAALEAERAAAGETRNTDRPIRWLTPLRTIAAAALLIALAIGVVAWSSSGTPDNPGSPGTPGIGRYAILGPATPDEFATDNPLHVDAPLDTTMQIGVATTGTADWLIDSDTDARLTAPDCMQIGNGGVAVVARQPVRMVTTHEQPIEISFQPVATSTSNRNAIVVAYVRALTPLPQVQVSAPDANGRCHLTARMNTVRQVLEAAGRILGADIRDEPADSPVLRGLGNERICAMLHANVAELPGVLRELLRPFPVSLEADPARGGNALKLVALPGSGGHDVPRWFEVEVRAGQAVVRCGNTTLQLDAASNRSACVAARFESFHLDQGSSNARGQRWPSAAAERMLHQLDRLPDNASRERVQPTLQRLFDDFNDPTRPLELQAYDIELPQELRDLDLERQRDHNGRPAVLFRAHGGEKLLREGDALNGWTIQSICHDGLNVVSPDGSARKWLALN